MKKLLSIILLFALVLSYTTAFAQADEKDITVYLTVSIYGEIASDKEEKSMALAGVNLSGKEEYNVDDAFKTLHEKYHEDGEEGYSSSMGDWGLSVDKLWGDQSGNFGYYVNGEMVFGLDHKINDGDYIDALVYKNYYPDTENYAKFDVVRKVAYTGEKTEITLYESGYDEDWNVVFSPCEGAVITIDGEETEFVTDDDGRAYLDFSHEGTKIVSAKKEKTLNDENVPSITAPVCIFEVKEHAAVKMINNIAKKYRDSDISDFGGNLPWIVADMAVYEKLYPESENVFSEEVKIEAVKEIVSLAKESEKPGDIAKSIIALRSLGYDVRKIYTEEFEFLDLAGKLSKMVDEKAESVTNIYTLPYVIIALCQAEDYAPKEKIDFLVNAAIESKDAWISTEFGTDAMTPMILALSNFAHDSAVKDIVDEAIEALKAEQREDGLIDGFEGYESASTGLALCAFSAMGIDAEEIINGENSLIKGLLSTANEDFDEFSNAFATEQGFRGLLAWKLLEEGKIMYDFEENPMEEANISGVFYCPVIFETKPNRTKIEIEGMEEITGNLFDLEAGTYEYLASASGYKKEKGEFEITEDDVLSRTPITIEISLSKKASSGTGGGGSSVRVPVEAKPQENTEKPEASAEAKPEESAAKPEAEAPVTEVPVNPAEEVFPDVKKDDWYYKAVMYTYENKLFGGTPQGFMPNESMTRAMLATVLYRLLNTGEKAITNPFSDISEDAWYKDSVAWALEKGIVKGISEKEFAPDKNITREDIAVIIFRCAEKSGCDMAVNGDGAKTFDDYDKISEYAKEAFGFVVEKGIITGMTKTTLSPKDNATRAEVATIIMRFAEIIR